MAMASSNSSGLLDPLLPSSDIERELRSSPSDGHGVPAEEGQFLNPQDLLKPTVPALQSDFQTILNTINLYVGVGLLSIGYAVKLGGWVSLIMLAACTYIFSWTAKLLCWSAQKLPPGTVPSYPNIGRAALGPSGEWAVRMAVVLEFWGALGLCLIILWQSIVLLLPPVPELCLHVPAIGACCLSVRYVAILGSSLLVVPAVLLPSLSRLTSIAMSGVMGSTLLCSVVAMAYALDPDSAMVDDPQAHVHHLASLPDLPVAAGMFIVSLSGHAGLPSLRRSMQHPHHFNHCINVTFAAMFTLYCTMAVFSYLYFGDSLDVLVTASLTRSSSVAALKVFQLGSYSLSLSQALTVLVAISVYSTVPTLVFVMAELLLDLLAASKHPGQPHRHAGVLEAMFVRVVVAAMGYATAMVGYDVLAHVESLVGGVCSILVSLLFPAIIYFQLYRASLKWWHRYLLYSLLLLGVVSAVGILVKNVLELCSL